MSHHNVRSQSDLFTSIASGKLLSDLRRNDRNYRAGDSITFHEIETYYNEDNLPYIRLTGNSINAQISHVITFEQYSNHLVGLEDHKDLVVLSIANVGLMIAHGAADLFLEDA